MTPCLSARLLRPGFSGGTDFSPSFPPAHCKCRRRIPGGCLLHSSRDAFVVDLRPFGIAPLFSRKSIPRFSLTLAHPASRLPMSSAVACAIHSHRPHPTRASHHVAGIFLPAVLGATART